MSSISDISVDNLSSSCQGAENTSINSITNDSQKCNTSEVVSVGSNSIISGTVSEMKTIFEANSKLANENIITPNYNTNKYIDNYRIDLKGTSQSKNIEETNEKRRNFLSDLYNGNRNNFENRLDDEVSVNGSLTNSLNSPRQYHVAPPKPPMLSRTRSLGLAETQISNGNEPKKNNYSHKLRQESPITTARIMTSTAPEPTKAATVQVHANGNANESTLSTTSTINSSKNESCPTSSKETSSVHSSTPIPPPSKQISIAHYNRLIEELKCPGCSFPFKSPVLLCSTGHSICQQCTRMQMLCPLCKEPFTDIRSYTVEALCSKAQFRCTHADAGCTVRLQSDLLSWHERRCIYKPMKCFMGRVWGKCDWNGREINWKDHLEEHHMNKLFQSDVAELVWNIGVKQKPLTGYYVFLAFDEMFNFYEVFDNDRVLFTMTCTSSIRRKKHNYAFEVTILHQTNEALSLTQKFPVHSEYDKDILMDGTCVSISQNDLTRFIDDEKLIHYRVRVLEVNSPRYDQLLRNAQRCVVTYPKDYHNTKIDGVNIKQVPVDLILTRHSLKFQEQSASQNLHITEVGSSEDEIDRIRKKYNEKYRHSIRNESESDPEIEMFYTKWSTPKMNFNRKYLQNSDKSENTDEIPSIQSNSQMWNPNHEETTSTCSATLSYTKKVSHNIRKSFRSFKTFNRSLTNKAKK